MTTLERVRAEIAEFKDEIAELPNMADAYAVVKHCLVIIDKYAEQDPCENNRLYIKVYADLEPQEKAEKLYQICEEDELKEVYKELGEYCDIEPCDDVVSREAVLDALADAGNWAEEFDSIKALPSLTPKPTECEDAVSRQAVLDLIEHYNSDGLGSVFYGYEQGMKFANAVNKLQSVRPQEPCDDVVSRQAVLKIIDGWYEQNRDTENIEDLIVLITYMDSVRPQEQAGHWIGIDEEPHEDYECDKCGYVVSTYTANIEPHTEYKYCPNCGARMAESEDNE